MLTHLQRKKKAGPGMSKQKIKNKEAAMPAGNTDLRGPDSYTARAVKIMGRHPYISAFAVCLFMDPFFLGATNNIPENALLLEALMLIVSVTAFIFHCYKKGKMKKLPAIATGIAAVFLVLSLGAVYSLCKNRAMWHFFGGIILTAVIFLLSDWKNFRRQMTSFVILGTGFFLKLYYVLGTGADVRQHDVANFESSSGHAGYISYLMYEKHLPDFDIRERWQFCHPPLHHLIGAVWIWIHDHCLMVSTPAARENLQTLTLFYSMCIMISAYKILRYFKLEGKALYIPLVLISFHPAFIMFSGSINNDVLSVAFMSGAIVNTLEWYKENSLKNIIKIALCIGFGMMAKLTAALVAPAVALVFLIVFIKNIKNFKKYLVEFVIFGCICVPLGLWYEIRNYIKWKVPITYVQELPEGLIQNISGMKYSERITDFSRSQFESVFEQWAYLNEAGELCGYNEHNPLIALMKNSLFGEYISQNDLAGNLILCGMAKVFFWLAAFIAALAFVCMITGVVRNGKKAVTEKIFLVIFYFSMMFNFYKMAYDYPFTCTLNFRYITLTVIVPLVFAGIILDSVKDKKKAGRFITVPASVLATGFTGLSTVIFLAVCYIK